MNEEEKYLDLAKSFCYVDVSSMEMFYKRFKITKDQFDNMLKWLKTNKPAIYMTVLSNKKYFDNPTNPELINLISDVAYNILKNQHYSIIDYMKDTNGLACKKARSIFKANFSKDVNDEYRKIVEFLTFDNTENYKVNSEMDIRLVVGRYDGHPITEHLLQEERQAIINYIKENGWPLNPTLYRDGILKALKTDMSFTKDENNKRR